MSSRTMPMILLAVGAIIVVALAVLNLQNVPFSLFGAAVSLPEGVLLGGGFLLGVALTFPIITARLAADKASGKALSKWDQEDQKLLGQIQTDREKQLEAKIATLEAALQKALKK